MKAHGIAGNNGAARAGSAGPSEPGTPLNKKTPAATRPSTNKKRKLAARGDDLDEHVKTEVKTEVKPEVKEEDTAFYNSDGSYMAHPSAPFEATASTLVMAGDGCKTEYSCGDEDLLLVSKPQTDFGGSAAPMAFIQQMLMPSPADGFYGFIDPASDMRLLSPTSHPFGIAHGHDADYPTQTLSPPEPTTGHWLQHHQNTSFF